MSQKLKIKCLIYSVNNVNLKSVANFIENIIVLLLMKNIIFKDYSILIFLKYEPKITFYQKLIHFDFNIHNAFNFNFFRLKHTKINIKYE